MWKLICDGKPLVQISGRWPLIGVVVDEIRRLPCHHLLGRIRVRWKQTGKCAGGGGRQYLRVSIEWLLYP